VIFFKINKEAKKLVELLLKKEYESYLVGGCVRDIIMNREPKDWDISTNASINQLILLFENEGYKVIPTGIKHGTLSVLINKKIYEISTFKGNSITDDLLSRDFTINSLAFDNENKLIDPSDGLADINNRIIRSYEPEKILIEDPIRMLRAVRFKAELGFNIENETKYEILKHHELLKKVSVERIREEFNKIILSDPYKLLDLVEFNLMKYICPEFNFTVGVDQKNPNNHLNIANHIVESMISIPPDLVLRLTMFFHDIGKPQTMKVDSKGVGHFFCHNIISKQIAHETLKRLKYSNKIIKDVEHLIHYHGNFPNINEKAIRRFIRKHGIKYVKLLLFVWRADMKAQEKTKLQEKLDKIDKVESLFKKIIENNDSLSFRDLKINGNDLIELGVKQGPEVGNVLNILLDEVINEPSKNQKSVLTELTISILKNKMHN